MRTAWGASLRSESLSVGGKEWGAGALQGSAWSREDGAGGVQRQWLGGAQPQHQACLHVPCSKAQRFLLAASLLGASCIIYGLSPPWLLPVVTSLVSFYISFHPRK